MARAPDDARAVVHEALVEVDGLHTLGAVERRLRVVRVQDRAAVLVQELRPVERLVVDLEAVLVALAVPVGVLRDLRGRGLPFVPGGRDLDALLPEDVGAVEQRVDVEIEEHRHDVAVVRHRVDTARRVLIGDRLLVHLSAGQLRQVGEQAVRGERRDPRHVERRDVGRVAGRHLDRELLVQRVPVDRLVFHGDPGIGFLEVRDHGLDRRGCPVVVLKRDRDRLVTAGCTGRRLLAASSRAGTGDQYQQGNREEHAVSAHARPPLNDVFTAMLLLRFGLRSPVNAVR